MLQRECELLTGSPRQCQLWLDSSHIDIRWDDRHLLVLANELTDTITLLGVTEDIEQ